MMKPSLKPEEIIHIGEYQRHYHYYKPKHTHIPPNQHLILFWMYQSKQDLAVSAAWLTQAPCQAHQPPPTFYSGGSQLTQFWPWEGGAVGSAGLADKSFWPLALCPLPFTFLFLPAWNRMWCLEALGPSCDMKTNPCGWTEKQKPGVWSSTLSLSTLQWPQIASL